MHLSVIAAAARPRAGRRVLARPLQPRDRRVDDRSPASSTPTSHAVIPTKGDPRDRRRHVRDACSSRRIWTRSWRLPLVGVAVLAVIVVAVGGIYPALVQSLKVRPSEKSLEVAVHPAQHQRDPRGLRASRHRGQPLRHQDRRGTRASCAATRATVPGIRLIDPNIVSPTFKQLQASKGYYQFADVLDVDRYNDRRQVAATPSSRRASSTSTACPTASATGSTTTPSTPTATASSPPRATPARTDGKPVFFESQIGTDGRARKYEPRIYFGESSPEYSIVGGEKHAAEFDYPDPQAAPGRSTTRTPARAACSSTPVKRLAYAIKYREINFLLSDAVNNDSRILDHRTPRDRVQRVAPWLTLDGNAYPAVVDGRVHLDPRRLHDVGRLPLLRDARPSTTATDDAVTSTRTSVQAVAGRPGQLHPQLGQGRRSTPTTAP